MRTPRLFSIAASWSLLLTLACGDDVADNSSVPLNAGTGAGSRSRPPVAATGGQYQAGKPGDDANAGRGGGAGKSAGNRAPKPGDETDADAGTREPLQSVTVRFAGHVADEPLQCGRTYAGLGTHDTAATPSDFRFYVEEVTLFTSAGRAERLSFAERAPFQSKAVALIDFTDQQGACGAGQAAINTTITGQVPSGDYQAIELVLGVPESINHQDFATAKAPLDDASTYWGWTNGYRFILAAVEAQVDDVDAGAAASQDTTSVVHVGAGGCAGANTTGFTCSRPNRARVRLEGFSLDSSVIVADLARVFSQVDLRSAFSCHGFQEGCESQFAAFGLNGEGGVSQQQRVFRLMSQ